MLASLCFRTMFKCQNHHVALDAFKKKTFCISALFCPPTQKSSGQVATKYAMKTLAVCTATSHLAREELLTADKSETWLTDEHHRQPSSWIKYHCIWPNLPGRRASTYLFRYVFCAYFSATAPTSQTIIVCVRIHLGAEAVFIVFCFVL